MGVDPSTHGIRPQSSAAIVGRGQCCPGMRSEDIRLHELDDNALLRALDDYNGTPKESLRDNEVMELLIRVVRADSGLLANHTIDARRQSVPVPIDVLSGT
ncbi:hypothetical protein ACPOL_1828 [Acidisarcina polymorpha]|uniref:Uncharacterized protein n=1 Tax=Acidisarcina polymorpha TaxID=2211140 RepID=A0A2Z5FWU4_9BACT|nr:hypothetical protein ACPOL_1828 [Acidisarcina polymorpha]